ncbi:hypothetical protein [Campylobacter troglodytis]|uniref:hypothetical protein n=1 Tax=Campylobacter troglodytis TaxID=654363 RepID=UPI00163CBAA1|nr:hypothetical protein [Campylobacter troglodytis]
MVKSKRVRVIFCFVSSCNCVVEGARRVHSKRGRGAKNACVFTSCYALVPLRECMLKR